MIPEELDRAVYGLVSTPVLHLADRHGVFGYLIEHPGANPTEIAAATGVSEDTLERLLLVLVAFGVLVNETPGEYTLPERLRPYLDRSDDRYVGGFVTHLVTSSTTHLARLESYLTRGKAAVDAELPEPFETFYRDEDAVRAFMRAMWDLSFGVSRELVALAGLHEVATLVDVGGASGPFATAALLEHASLRAVVFDLPQVEPYVGETAEKYRFGDRLGFTGGDFFRDALPAGECVAFGYVLSDWDDETCAALLAKAFTACAPGGRVLVMERLFDDDRSGPLATAVMNLDMHTEARGRHRTVAEYQALLAAAGFTATGVRRSSRDKHLIIGHKPA